MLTDTSQSPPHAARFALRAVAWSLGLFGLLRLVWVEAHVVLPLTRVQGALASGLFGAPAAPVEVTLACSGTDALALCLGAVLAYPVRWRARLAGAAGAVALILGLNIIRIGTLGRAAVSPAWFDALHLYIWPAVLTLAIAGYVFAWMSLADGGPREPSVARPPTPTRRFVVLTAALLLLFVAVSPLYLESAGVLALAGFIARAAGAILGAAGVSAHATDNVLWTSRGGFLVTQECISTPLIPIYLAAVLSVSATWRRRVVAVVAVLPIFTGLGIARLLVVALPDAVGSPLFFVHAFYQLLLGAAVVFLAARWRHGGRAAAGYALAGVAAGVAFGLLLGHVYTRAIMYPSGAPADDPQGAIGLLPAFQVGLYLALWVAAFVSAGWAARFVAGLAVLGLSQAAALAALDGLATAGLTAHVRDVRAWAVAGPVLIFAAVIHVARARR